MRRMTGLLGVLLLAGCGAQEPDAAADNDAAPAAAAPAVEAVPANLTAPEPVGPEETVEPAEASGTPERAAPAAGAPVAEAPPAAEATVEKAAVAAVRPASFAMCQACHSTGRGEPHRVGPNLFGVAGAKAGSKPGFAYSDAMKKSGIVWTRDRLDAFLAAPRTVVPGTKMVMTGPKDPAKRQEIVDYLASLR